MDQLALREWVWTAISELPEVLMVTAVLRYFGRYPSYEEIQPSSVYRSARSRAA
ncbi:hypothetical protein [Rubrobacter calidifluminis]|uniref:hypothetical protein n=1 Tax=Rubrobacter calidifluminis TaxID=1392640 RepID=UPI002361FD0C|nr:hypothetical protein [Rubrobacter calidifluminis]